MSRHPRLPRLRRPSLELLSLCALGLVLVAPLAGCDKKDDGAVKEKCAKLADHMADVLTAEYDGEVDDEARKRMVNGSKEACVGAPPSDEQHECAMKAQTAKAIRACDDDDAAGGE